MTSSKTPREFYLGKNYWYSDKDMNYLVSDKIAKREDHIRVIDFEAYQALEKELREAKAVIQRQAELISYLINEYPQTKDLAKIKAEFVQYTAVNDNTGE